MAEDQYYSLLALVAAVLGWRRYVARPRPVTGDAELLARTMYAETSGRQKHPDEELAAIGYVGLNRARDGYTLAEVLTPPGRSDYGVWNKSGRYQDRWYTADSKAGYQRCLEVAEAILAGTMPNPIGGRALFYHPGGLKRCTPGEDVGERWVCVSTHAGNRRVPRWGLRSPVRVGDAVFCGDREPFGICRSRSNRGHRARKGTNREEGGGGAHEESGGLAGATQSSSGRGGRVRVQAGAGRNRPHRNRQHFELKLPSTKAAEDLIAGRGAGGVVRTTITRAAVIAAAGYAAGARGQPLIRTAAAGAIALELVVLAYAFMSRPKTNTR